MIKRIQNIDKDHVIVNDNELSKLEGESEAYQDLYRAEKFLNTNLETENAELRERVGELLKCLGYAKWNLTGWIETAVYERITGPYGDSQDCIREIDQLSSPVDVEKGEEG